jgi:hypothetical protein
MGSCARSGVACQAWSNVRNSRGAIRDIRNTIVVAVGRAVDIVMTAIGRTGSAVMMLLASSAESDVGIISVVLDAKTETSRINVAMTEQEQSSEDGLGEQVEDAVEDGLGVWSNDVSSLTHTPGDRIELWHSLAQMHDATGNIKTHDPQDSCQGSTVQVDLLDIIAEAFGIEACLPHKNVHDVRERSASESEVTPLVAGADESANQAGDDHDFVYQNDPQHCRPWQSCSQEQVHEEKRCGDDPDKI